MKTESVKSGARSIAEDLAWVDMLKGMAIIGVFFDNWTAYMEFDPTPALLHSLAKAFALAVGPFVHVFFILSGFGLTLSYLKGRGGWDWRRWAWRRLTKIVVPYIAAVIFSFVLGVLGSFLHPSVDMEFSWVALLKYLTFTRNFYPEVWGWNRPLWFMPVIVGLYLSFPILIKILEKWGAWALVLVAAMVTYGTITVAVLAGAPRTHQADLFSFWAIQFALGMVLACVRDSQLQKMGKLVSLEAFCLGVGLFAFSWALREYLPVARAYNDLLTSIGIFLILLNLCWAVWLRVPAIERFLSALSSKSFLMYLVHYPIMAFLIGPPLRVFTNALVVIALGGVYILVVFLLCSLVSSPVAKLTSWLYRQYRPGLV
jgi:peptidoglycan/LPS O-acetylase OafA/YrhL